jgi:ribosome-binding factor A
MARSSRLSRVVKEAVAEILRGDIADPRLRLVTITDAEVTADQSYATVYYSTLSEDILARDPERTGGDRPADDEAVAAAFDSARGRIQGLLGQRLTSRKTPELTFRLDPVADQAARVEALIRKVRSEEADPASGHVGAVAADEGRQPDRLDPDGDATTEADGPDGDATST